MDPRLQASFIPKKPFTESSIVSRPEKSGINFFLLAAGILLVITLAAAIVVFLLNLYEQRSIASKNQSIEAYVAAHNYSSYQDFTRLDDRLKVASSLLSQHVSLSTLFNIIAGATAQDISFSSLKYQSGATTTASLVLSGIGKNFNAVAYQSDVFDKVPSLSGVAFSGIKLNDQGSVSFSVNANIDTGMLSFVKNYAAGSGGAVIGTVSTPSSASASTTTGTTNGSGTANTSPIISH